VLITRRSPLTGEETTLDLPVTEDQLNRHANGEALIQDIFPDLTPAQREFIKTGYTGEDWQAMFHAANAGVVAMSACLVTEIQSLLWGIVESCPGSPNCMNSPCFAKDARELLQLMGEDIDEPADDDEDE
jgi:hypothetical protein